MGRWFLKCLQQRVERVFRQHVHFVDDVDLVPSGNGGIAHRLNNLSHVIDACVARSVHFDHVDVPPVDNRNAGIANAAWFDGRPTLPIRPRAI